jgi:uncharacterized membrane protein YeaQ/YmgE (transglycosylase-associated protein family)
MKRATRFAARLLYPQQWRQRYGAEFDALIDDTAGSGADFLDVLSGGVAMRVRMSHPAVVTLLLGLVGSVVAGLGAFAVPARFESRGTMQVIAPAAADTERLPALFTEALTGGFADGEVSPQDVSVTRNGDQGDVVQVAYATADAQRARDVVTRVMGQVVEANLRLAEAGSSPMQVRIVTPAALPRASSRPHLLWLTIGGVAGVIAGAITSLRRRVSS